jgi:vitamin B12 transporter
MLFASPALLASGADEAVIVTASRMAETADETLAPVSVLTRKDIERLQAQSVQDLLARVPGVSISNSGGLGKLSSVFLRGSNSDHVLVLIDGIKVGSATSGTTAFEQLPVEQIERIEVVRGPRSSLYGSEAIGGVIQIFTRKGGGALTPYLSMGGGTNPTYQAAAGVSGGGDRAWFNAALDVLDTEGINACNGDPINFAGCFANEPDHDGFDSLGGTLRAGYRFDNGAEAELHFLRSDGDNEYDGSFTNESDTVQQVLGGKASFSPTEAWQINLNAGQARDSSDDSLNGTPMSRFETERNSVSLQNDITIGDDRLLSIGLDYLQDRVDSDTPFNEDSRDNTGLFAQYRAGYGAHDLQLALRGDDNEQSGSHSTGNIAWGYAFHQDLRLTASFGTAFKAPSFNELYYPADPVFGGGGNPDLDPEESQSFELGVNGTIQSVGWSLNAYHTQVDELIGLDASFAPINIDEARILGLEAVLSTTLAGWDIHTSATFLDPENRSDGANDGNVLPRRARQILDLALDRDFGRYRLGATLHTENKRYDDLANNVAMGGYATVDLRAEYRLTPDWRVQGSVTNLFDKDYETANLYNQPGQGFFLTLRYQPDTTAARTTP